MVRGAADADIDLPGAVQRPTREPRVELRCAGPVVGANGTRRRLASGDHQRRVVGWQRDRRAGRGSDAPDERGDYEKRSR